MDYEEMSSAVHDLIKGGMFQLADTIEEHITSLAEDEETAAMISIDIDVMLAFAIRSLHSGWTPEELSDLLLSVTRTFMDGEAQVAVKETRQ